MSVDGGNRGGSECGDGRLVSVMITKKKKKKKEES